VTFTANHHQAGAILSRASLTGASLTGAYRPENDIVGWTADEHGHLGRS
jgi:uncharacterized protein YjbI with pentapeptide repeats